MSILDNIVITQPGAPRITLYGVHGIGKTTLASQFPDPVFILTEDNECPGIKAFPICQSYVEVCSIVKQLLALEELPFKTLVIDSITKLDTLICEYVMEKSVPVKSSGQTPEVLSQACGGYGAGFEKATSHHRALKMNLDKFKDRDIAVIYISHVAIKKFKSPETEEYDTLSIIMNGDSSRSVYLNDVDMVALCKSKSHIVETESGRNLVKSTGRRVIAASVNDAFVSKNRYNMPSEIDLSFDELSKYIPFYNKG